MDDTPLGLTEVEENQFRNLLSRLREHDPDALTRLCVDSILYRQVPDTLVMKQMFDQDSILTSCVVVAKGTAPASQLNRVMAENTK